MLRPLQRLLPLGALALLLAGCAGGVDRLTGETPLERYSSYAGTPVDRFTAFNVTGWTALSDSQLVLWTGVNEAWLVTVWNGCRDLQFANRIRVAHTGSSITRFDQIIVGRDRCPISEIRPVDVRQMRADRAAAAQEQRP